MILGKGIAKPESPGDVVKLTGNHVVLSTEAGYVLCAHLQHGSLTVGDGDRVRAGEQLGRVGNSGNTMGPHLHIQVMDGPDPMTAAVTPFRLTRFSQLTPDGYVDRTDEPLPAGTARVRFPARGCLPRLAVIW